ncbi:MAG: hypothetical protein C6P37_15620 [Caldibacillus debilis]|uniref:Uncharacterized protein n=1 Tax=Caldibacillus debilis TaxID=301148 RepID=A0A3E0JX69_9BACI|nr:MAG: hypothetical protein C6P37_15620 [Caldibacillus debilis]
MAFGKNGGRAVFPHSHIPVHLGDAEEKGIFPCRCLPLRLKHRSIILIFEGTVERFLPDGPFLFDIFNHSERWGRWWSPSASHSFLTFSIPFAGECTWRLGSSVPSFRGDENEPAKTRTKSFAEGRCVCG